MRRLLMLLWLCLSLGTQAAEFLDPALAFKPTVRALDAQTLEVRFEIAEGYYLYRDKFRFAAEGVRFGPAALPKGKEKDDETFGKVDSG